MIQTGLQPGIRRLAVLYLWLANVGLGVCVGSNYLLHVPDVDDPKIWFFALPALVSSVLTLTLVPGVLFLIAAHLIRSVRLFGILQASIWTVFLVLLYTDTRLYNIFRYHINGQVLNLVYTRGSEDSIHLGWQVWTVVAIGLVSVGWLEAWIWRRAMRLAMHQKRLRTSRLRPLLASALGLGSLVFVDKTIYAQADLNRDRQVTALARIFPLYTRLPIDDLATRVLGETPRVPRVEVEGFELDYPRQHPDIDLSAPRPNFLVLVVDCWRHDMLDEEVTPNLHRFSQTSRVFTDHVSAGNSTRFGLFSMLYGLHGSYWFPMLRERRSPVLVDTLLDLGYVPGIFSAASQGYPEMKDTAWRRIPEQVFDEFGTGPSWRRDELVADAFTEWLGEREGTEDPFFAFILLDSPHQTYSHPPHVTPFEPSAPEMDYIEMTRNEGPAPEVLEAVRNRYFNAVHHADAVSGRILDALESSGFGEETVVVVTGDHGEEFWENGFFGHTSAFTSWQVAVPFLMRGPGIEPGTEDRPTSHNDLPATLLEIVGADPTQRRHWTLGGNLLHPPELRRRVISGWNELGVWTPNGILRVPLSLLEFDVEVYDYDWRLVMDDGDVLEREAATLMRLGAECNYFLR